ncbi:hypothetical protein HYPBUDRAFT_152389 [Hyphopichia burtonii NRRL Y-1933]|uniref:Thioesterase domain-containing protein n=1 Tax=Hyphopichia burtonii NRRL Y-1933 TaxID=984485 RepID=A0A1E4RJJ6_9ASCO|nr:hypothetical protein HYPBUDRAFT_152389 [Hyphopichia burtonii NRRL Y-1933]ODV67448.1 hypothetical protein HYPBUDRAFT_152389 [Hyphopichia burtonii NRRL Y-1933]
MGFIKSLTRVTTPLVAFGLGFAFYPKDFRKGNLADRKLTHINQSVLEQIEKSKEYQALLTEGNSKQYYGSHAFPEQHMKNYVGSGLLFGPNLFEIDPILFLNEEKGTLTGFYHLGDQLISQDGEIHNGVVSTILDEGLCSCGFPQLPSKKGVTAKLSINFQNQAPPNSTVVLKAHISESKGRKVVIDGTLETLPLREGDKPLVIADSKCILVEPKWFKYFSWAQVF